MVGRVENSMFSWFHCFFFNCLVVIIPRLLSANRRPLADCVDEDQTVQNMQFDLGSLLSDKEIFLNL